MVLDCDTGVESLGLDPTSDRKLAQRSSDFFFCLASSSLPTSVGFSTSSCGGCVSSAPPPPFSSLSTVSTTFFLFLLIFSKIPVNKDHHHWHHLLWLRKTLEFFYVSLITNKTQCIKCKCTENYVNWIRMVDISGQEFRKSHWTCLLIKCILPKMLDLSLVSGLCPCSVIQNKMGKLGIITGWNQPLITSIL